MSTKLRFAALRRVSTEQQEQHGESLRTQETQLKQAVATMGGEIVAWYGGQEHATPGYEKEEVGRLLYDAQRHPKRFDAVVVTEPDRWSRDNASSQAGVEVFKRNKIQFFTGTTEWKLSNPSHALFLGLNAEIGKFFAHNQMKKSLENRIERAKRGLPSAGHLPFGRTWVWDDPKTRQSGHWGENDPKKQALIVDCAKRYLGGESIKDLATEYGMDSTNLHKVLTQNCGPQWTVRFRNEALEIDETIELKVPQLLDDQTIKNILAKVVANKTYTHGHIKNHYLFSRMIGCAHCGSMLSGQTSLGFRYYRHFKNETCQGPAKKGWVLLRFA